MKNLSIKKNIAVFNYSRKNYKTEFIAALLFFLVAIIWVYGTNSEVPLSLSNMDSWYTDWLDPIATVGTLFFAFFIWWDSKRKEWIDSLSKRVTIHFKHGKKYVISCYNINVGSKDDLRAFSQQVGAQFTKEGRGRLALIPGVIEYPAEVIRIKNGKFINYQKLEYYLTEPHKDLMNKYHGWIFKKIDSIEAITEDATVNNYQIKEIDGVEEVYERIVFVKDTFPTSPEPFNPEKQA
jgi:hypothetical protein